MPAQLPRTGPPDVWNEVIASSRPSRSMPIEMVVDSPPGMTSPSRPFSSAGVRTSLASAPSSASMRRWASKSPCRARTPIFSGAIGREAEEEAPWSGTAALKQATVLSQGLDFEARHRVPELHRSLRDSLRILEVGRGFNDRASARCRVLALEDARADEVALGAQLHHQRRIRRSGDAPGAEEGNRQPASLRDVLHDVEWS